jgi:hypothetical protein
VSPLRLSLIFLTAWVLAQPKLRRQERDAANVGETVARYMVERDQRAAEAQAEALAIARSSRRWAMIAGIAAVVGIPATIIVALLAG